MADDAPVQEPPEKKQRVADEAEDNPTSKCPHFEAGCPYSKLIEEKLGGKKLSEMCPAFKNGTCPFNTASAEHDAHSVNAETFKQCPAFKSENGCPYKHLLADHHVESSGDVKECPVFATGCPYKAALKSTPEGQCPVDHEALAKMREAKCPIDHSKIVPTAENADKAGEDKSKEPDEATDNPPAAAEATDAAPAEEAKPTGKCPVPH